MSKKGQFDKATDWYDVWMQQSRTYFESADEHVKELFAQNVFAKPEENLKDINKWLESLKSRWERTQGMGGEDNFHPYWKMVSKMYQDAADLMLKEWIKRSHGTHPVNGIHDLYELWLSSCHQVYQQTLHTKMYQDMYGDLMSAAAKFWQTTTSMK